MDVGFSRFGDFRIQEFRVCSGFRVLRRLGFEVFRL